MTGTLPINERVRVFTSPFGPVGLVEVVIAARTGALLPGIRHLSTHRIAETEVGGLGGACVGLGQAARGVSHGIAVNGG